MPTRHPSTSIRRVHPRSRAPSANGAFKRTTGQIHSTSHTSVPSRYSTGFNLDDKAQDWGRGEVDTVFGFGWAAVLQYASGEKEAATMNGRKAVPLMQTLLDSPSVRRSAEATPAAIDYRLPHLLVLLAGMQLSSGRPDDALERVEEVMRMGPPTRTHLDASQRI
ncbi:hypothetical protein OC834_006273 [Tilletia horrida]|nr:hypothetical protein OC834_006273 [Tilletia horrida]